MARFSDPVWWQTLRAFAAELGRHHPRHNPWQLEQGRGVAPLKPCPLAYRERMFGREVINYSEG